MDLVFVRSWRRVTVISLSLAGLVFIWVIERESVERGNRLHRSVALPQAVVVYRGRTERVLT